MSERKTGGVSRSPNSPSTSLSDVIEAAEKLWQQEKRTPVSNETAAQHFGFKSLSGPARVMIGSLRQYGLIERTSDGHFKLTELAIRVVNGTPEQRRAALAMAALTPPLFRELAKTHRNASFATIKSHLIVDKGFVDFGAQRVALAFINTMGFAQIPADGYDGEKDEEQSEINSDRFEDTPMAEPTSGRHHSPAATAPETAMIPPVSWILSVPRGVRAELRITGKDVRRDDLERLKRQIDFLVESFDDDEAK